MLRLTQRAAQTLQGARVDRNLPADHGVRVYGIRNEDGEVAVRIGFAAAPANADAVDEQHGTRLFVDPDVVTVLADAEIDVRDDDHEGTELQRLVLRRRQPGQGDG